MTTLKHLAPLTVIALLCAAPARAADNPITEYPLTTEGHRPQAIALGPDGNLWVTEVLLHLILRITPEGKITELQVPATDIGVFQGIAAGPDGNLYFTSREENAIRRVTPKGEFTGLFKIPSVAIKADNINKGSWPREITAGPDGNLYFTEMAANKIARITTKGEFKEFDIPTADSKPYGIVTGPDKKIWFSESATDKIARFDPATAKFDEFTLPTAKAFPRDIALGPDGNLWCSENQIDKIARITPAGEIKEFDLPKGSRPIGITAGPDGNLWIACFGSNKIARMTPEGKVTEFALPTPKSQPFGLTTGPDKNIWIAEQANRIAKLDLKAAAEKK